MNVALLVIYVFNAASLGMAIAKHGEPKTGRHDFWVTFFSIGINLVLIWWALGWRFL